MNYKKRPIKFGAKKEWQYWKDENVLGLSLRKNILKNPMVAIPSTEQHSNFLLSFWGIENLKREKVIPKRKIFLSTLSS